MKIVRYIVCLLAAAVMVMAATPACLASPSIGFYEDWSGGVGGWTSAPPIGAGITTLSTVGANPYLQISFPMSGPPPMSQMDIIYNTGIDYTGSYEKNGLAVKFNFLADDILPSSLQLYMLADSGREWLYGFDVTQVDAWQTFEVGFDYNYGSGWAGGTEAQFELDLGSIDAIGILIQSAVDINAQNYGLDMWVYFIPEPATWCLIFAALVSAGIPLRRRMTVS